MPLNIKEYNKKYYQDNKERLRIQHKKYRADNKEKIRDMKRKYVSNYFNIKKYTDITIPFLGYKISKMK